MRMNVIRAVMRTKTMTPMAMPALAPAERPRLDDVGTALGEGDEADGPY